MPAPDVTIRPVRPEDAAELYTIARAPEVAATMLFLPSMEYAETEEHVNKKVTSRHYLAAVSGERVVGSGILTHYANPRMAHAAKLGLMVHRDYWNQGIGTRLVSALLDIADNWLGLKRVELGVFRENSAGIHLYEKFGFEREGVKRQAAYGGGHWQDEIIMARLRNLPAPVEPVAAQPRPATPAEPVDFEIRPLHKEDMEALYTIFCHPEVARGTLQLPSQEIWLTRRRVLEPPPGMNRFVAVAGGQAIGTLSLTRDPKPRRAHVGALGMGVHPDYWNQGVGSALVAAALDLADNWLNLQRVELEVYTDNPAAVRLYQKYGFEIEGTHRCFAFGGGRWADSYFMARLREA